MTAPDFTVTLSPAQWEHLDRHGWTLVEAPTEPCVDSACPCQDGDACHYLTFPGSPAMAPARLPIPATVTCEQCGGNGRDPLLGPDSCGLCNGEGTVPRTVGIIRPERHLVGWSDYYGRHSNGASDPCPTGRAASCPVCVVIPAERVGTATVTAIPVIDVNGPWPQDEGAQFVTVGDGLVMLYTADSDADEGYEGDDLTGYGPDDPALFPTPPLPGSHIWRLDRKGEA